MTREEAIKRIKHHKIVHKMDEPNAIKISEALDMAIEALQARNVSADMIYDYLKKKIGSDITDNPFEFEDWFNRMTWHVQECHRRAWEIEALKTQSKWIPCSERMPEEREWIGTEIFGTTISDEVYVTFESPDGERFVKHLCFQNGMLSGYMLKQINAFHKGSVPIAWMPLPKPYREDGEE